MHVLSDVVHPQQPPKKITTLLCFLEMELVLRLFFMLRMFLILLLLLKVYYLSIEGLLFIYLITICCYSNVYMFMVLG